MNRALLLAGIALALGAGCLGEAPHDNPLDPASGLFRNEGVLAGQVMDRAARPLAGVEMRLIPGPVLVQTERVTQTDAQGRYAFDGTPAGGPYRLQAHKDRYAVGVLDALEVRAGLDEALPTLRLNALPQFTGIALRTIHLSRWWPENDLFFLTVAADVDDADGLLDIDRVWLDLPDLGFTATLEARAAGRFEKIIQADSLPAVSLQALMGRALRLWVRDTQDGVSGSAPQQLSRIIEQTPVAAAPQGLVLLETDRPTLTWDPFPAAYPFTYRIDVFRDEINRPVAARLIENLGMSTTSIQLAEPLPTGPYFWTVTVVDAFGNQSRSKEAGFRIP